MDIQTINTPEKLHQAIGTFLQSDYLHENLIKMYDDTRKCAIGFRGVYLALPVLPAHKDNPLDGLQDVMNWCDKSVKVVDDIVSNLKQQTISEVISLLKKLRGFADRATSLVDSNLKEQAQKEARAKVKKEYELLNEKASKTKTLLLKEQIEIIGKLQIENLMISRRENEDAIQIFLSKDPTFNNRLYQLGKEIDEVLKKLNELVDDNTPTGKLTDIYCKLKDIPLQQQFDKVAYAYSFRDMADVIFGNCNSLYVSIDNIIKTFEEIQTKAKQKNKLVEATKTSDLTYHNSNRPEKDKQVDEKRVLVLLDKFYQYIDQNLSCTLYEVPIPEKTSSPKFRICDQLYKPSYLSLEFWCDQENAHFIMYQGEKQAYDRFCQLAEIAAEFLPSPKDEKHSIAPDNKKRWVCHLVEFLRSEPKSNIKKHIYGKEEDFNGEMGDSFYTVTQEMLTLYNWAKTSTQKKVLVSSSDIKNLFNASTCVLEKIHKSIKGQPLKIGDVAKKKPLYKKVWTWIKKVWRWIVWIVAFLVAITTLLLNIKHVNEWLFASNTQPVTSIEKKSLPTSQQSEIAKIFAYVSPDGKILQSNNFRWKITKAKNQEGNIVYIINGRQGDTTAISVLPDNSISEHKISNGYDGMVITFTCAEEKISNFRIEVKY